MNYKLNIWTSYCSIIEKKNGDRGLGEGFENAKKIHMELSNQSLLTLIYLRQLEIAVNSN